MRTFERLSRDLLLWIHDEAGADTKKAVDPEWFPGRDTDPAKVTSAVAYLTRRGLVEPRHRRTMSGPVTLTPVGVDEAVREKDRPHRLRRARTNLLRWAYDQPDARLLPGADVTNLARDPRSVIDGEMMTIDELNAAARDLRDAGLVIIGAQDMNGGFSIGITDAGVACVERAGGDVPASADPLPPADELPDGPGLLRFARAACQALPVLRLPEDAATTVQTAAATIETELTSGLPDGHRVHTAAAAIRATLADTTGDALATTLLTACPAPSHPQYDGS